MIRESLARSFSKHLQTAIDAAKLPDGFYDTFEFTETGNNLCHPITLSIIGNAVARIAGVVHVGIDVRLNLGGGVKFQPDIVGFRDDRSHLLYVDFESPNSCDTRIKDKDILPYLNWVSKHHDAANYVVVTSLPDRQSPAWQLRWTSGHDASGRNSEHRQFRDVIRANPLHYWSKVWRHDLSGCDLSRVVLLNIDGKSVKRVDFP
jgi:hypothetical protein